MSPVFNKTILSANELLEKEKVKFRDERNEYNKLISRFADLQSIADENELFEQN